MTDTHEIPPAARAEVTSAVEYGKSGLLWKVDSAHVYQAAGDELRWIQGRIKSLTDWQRGLCDPLYDTIRRIKATVSEALTAYEAVKAHLKKEMEGFAAEQELIAESKRAEAEREAAKAREEMLSEAAVLLNEGRVDEALEKQIVSQMIVASEPEQTPKVRGVSTYTRWYAEVNDVLALARWVLEHPEMAHLIKPNMVELNSMAAEAKGDLNIPGVVPTEKKITAVRA